MSAVAMVAIVAALVGGFAAYDRAVRDPKPWLRAVMSAAALIAIAAAFVLTRTEPLVDFTAFYCGGHAVDAGANPYLDASLRACEIPKLGPLSWALPVVHPGYDLGLFAMFARLPFALAEVAWSLLSIAALAVSIVALRAITGLRAVTIAAAVSVPAVYSGLHWGQIAPLELAFVCTCGWMLAAGRTRWAGFAGGLTLLEPHTALGVAISLLITTARARVPLIATGAVLGLVSFAVLGTAGNLQYVHSVLPLHVLAESAFSDQYSLTMLLHVFGVGDRPADTIGMLDYLAMLALGTYLGIRYARRSRNAALRVLLPAAAAVTGGSFIHYSQLLLAVPAALALAASTRGRERVLALAAMVLLAVDWTSLGFGRHEVLAAIVLFVLVSTFFDAYPARKRFALAGAIAVAYAGVMVSMRFMPTVPRPIASSVSDFRREVGAPSDLASESWGEHLRRSSTFATMSVQRFAYHVPSWLGLIFVLTAAVRASFGRGRRAEGRTPAGRIASVYGEFTAGERSSSAVR